MTLRRILWAIVLGVIAGVLLTHNGPDLFVHKLLGLF